MIQIDLSSANVLQQRIVRFLNARCGIGKHFAVLAFINDLDRLEEIFKEERRVRRLNHECKSKLNSEAPAKPTPSRREKEFARVVMEMSGITKKEAEK